MGGVVEIGGGVISLLMLDIIYPLCVMPICVGI